MVTTTGNASAAAAGAGIAVARRDGHETADIDGTGGITAGTVLVAADSNNTVTTTATASPGGSTGNTTSPDGTTATTANPGGFANTSAGSITAAGALAYTNLSSTTLAYIAPLSVSGITVTATSPTGPSAWSALLRIHAGSVASSLVTADGSAATASAPGVGVAVAVNLANVVTRAYVTNATLKSALVDVEALDQAAATGTPNTFGATSSSGAGDPSGVGVAGSVAVNVVSLDTEATVPALGSATLGSGDDLLLNSASHVSHAVLAQAGATAGATFGIGATLALSIVNDTTAAGLGNGSSLTGARNLTLQATTGDAMNTVGLGGASFHRRPGGRPGHRHLRVQCDHHGQPGDGHHHRPHRPHRQLLGYGDPGGPGNDHGHR